MTKAAIVPAFSASEVQTTPKPRKRTAPKEAPEPSPVVHKRLGRPRVRAVIERDEQIFRLIKTKPRKLADLVEQTGLSYDEVYSSVRRLWKLERVDRVANTSPQARSAKINLWTVVRP